MEADSVRWVLSTLMQGSCAVYGLLLVYYVYQRGKSYEAAGALTFPQRVDPSSIDGKPTPLPADWIDEMEVCYAKFAEINRRDRITVWQLAWFSTLFVYGIILGALGLIRYSDEPLFWVATICLTGTIVVIGLSFMIIAWYVLGKGLTVGNKTVKKGKKFFTGEYEGQRFAVKRLDPEVRALWKRRTGWNWTYPAIYALVLLTMLLSVFWYFNQ